MMNFFDSLKSNRAFLISSTVAAPAEVASTSMNIPLIFGSSFAFPIALRISFNPRLVLVCMLVKSNPLKGLFDALSTISLFRLMYRTELSFTSTCLSDEDTMAPIIPIKMRNKRIEAIINPKIEASRYLKKFFMTGREFKFFMN